MALKSNTSERAQVPPGAPATVSLHYEASTPHGLQVRLSRQLPGPLQVATLWEDSR